MYVLDKTYTQKCCQNFNFLYSPVAEQMEQIIHLKLNKNQRCKYVPAVLQNELADLFRFNYILFQLLIIKSESSSLTEIGGCTLLHLTYLMK